MARRPKNKYFAFFVFVIAIFLIISHSVFAEEKPLSLDRAVNEALERNPEILAAKRAYEAANARIWQAASLSDPVLGFEYDKIDADRALTGEPMKMYSLSQDIPFPTKLYLRAKIASKMARMAYENYKAKEKSIIAQTKSAYAELFLTYRTAVIQNENKSILGQFSSSAETRYSANRGTQADALKAQIELAKIDAELIMLEQKRLTSQAKLNVLMNRDPREELGEPVAVEPVNFNKPIDELYLDAKHNNPELKAYSYAIDRGRAAYDLSLNEFMPDFEVKFRQMVKRDRVDEKSWAGMLGVTVPLWFFQKQAFGVKEMRSELEMLQAEYRAKENMILFDVRDAYARVEANKKIVELYETAFLPQADQTVKAALKGYESGQADFLTLLDSQRMLTEFKLDHYKTILEFRIALADLERTVGINLDKSEKDDSHAKK